MTTPSSPSNAPPDAGRPIFQRLDTTANRPYTPSEYLRRYLWLVVQATLVRLSPPRAYGWRRFWLRLFGANLTPSSRTGRTTHVHHPWLLTMGRHSHLAADVQAYNLGPIAVGDHSVVSHAAVLCAGTHDYTKPNLPLLRLPITIGSGVWVCTEAFIGPGVTVGDNAIVGARAVAMRDVPPGMIVAGNPAVVVKPRPMREEA
ncbi:MAG: hypothetical protein IT442_06310 [Phycisphaeraceae bacterium]|nr:hypothetical protein [Phycisphaeraceae bacterium]